GQRGDVVLLRQRQAAPVAGRQELVLAVAPTVPDRPDRVDDPLRRQAIATGDPRLPGLTAAERSALRQELRAGGAMDRAIDTAAAEQCRIRGVDDRVDQLPGDVALLD